MATQTISSPGFPYALDGYAIVAPGISVTEISAGGGTTVTVYYKMMGRDSACPTTTFHAWVVQGSPDFTGAQAGTLPCGGPLVDISIVDVWS